MGSQVNYLHSRPTLLPLYQRQQEGAGAGAHEEWALRRLSPQAPDPLIETQQHEG